jgi:hypothetical protein
MGAAPEISMEARAYFSAVENSADIVSVAGV